jgi:hypothetical protein
MANTPKHYPHNHPDSAQQESDDDSRSANPPVSIVDEQGHAYRKLENPYQRLKNAIKHLIAKVDHGERWMISLTAIVVFTTVSQAIQSCSNNRSTSQQVDRLIDAANRVDDAAESFSISASGINGGVSNAVSKLNDQAKKMDAARLSSEKQSSAALQATVDSFHTEDRAWVGISQTRPLNYVTDPVTHAVNMTVAFTFRNYGHSAAQHVRFIAELNSDFGDISVPCDELAKNHMEDVLLPTQEQTLNWAMNLTSAQMAKGWSHQNPQMGRMLLLKIAGCIEYTDRDDESIPHRTPFSYMVFWTKSYITADISTIPATEIDLEPYDMNPNTGHVK